MMKQLKKWVSHNVLEVIYKLYVRPHLDYGDVIYHSANTNKTDISEFSNFNDSLKKAESIQYEAARIVSGAWRGTSMTKLYDNLGWESLNNHRIMRKLCILHETTITNFPLYLHNIVNARSYREGSRYYNQKALVNIPCKKQI